MERKIVQFWCKLAFQYQCNFFLELSFHLYPDYLHLPLSTFHILLISVEYHHFPLKTRSHSNWPHEFGLRWLMLVRLYAISQHHNWGEILTARFAYSLTEYLLLRLVFHIHTCGSCCTTVDLPRILCCYPKFRCEQCRLLRSRRIF